MQRERDSKGYWLTYGIYQKALPYIRERFDMLREMDEEFKLKTVQYNVFNTIIRTYFTIVFERIIAGEKVKLFGWNKRVQSLQVVKTKPTRYEPTKKVLEKQEDGTTKRVEKKVKLFGDFAYFVFWDSPKKYRRHKFHADSQWKDIFIKKVIHDGFDYEDKTLPTGTHADYKILKSLQCSESKE